ncbi:hypothetical protein EDD86DRAFT_120175 [Gorgonomyces haynaldii]|nr:hypothetical protein EDD86DRAFT_120175 [Gorgonomyces haynaldii]
MSKYARDLLYAQYERQSCEGAPRSVYLFHTEDYTNPDQPDDEVWPSFYYFQTAEYDPTDCGNSKLSAIDVCCFSSADITESAPYQSGGPQFVERTDISSYLPASANGARFCHLQSQDLGNALFGYKEAFYLADDSETCIDEYITCSSSGLLKVFPNASCQGTPDRVVLLQTTSPYETPLLGSVDGRLLFVTNATVRYAWTAWTPSDKMVPDFTLWQERLSLSMYILSGVICAAMLGYQTRRMFLDPASRRLWGYGTLLQFSVWIAYLIVCYGYLIS